MRDEDRISYNQLGVVSESSSERPMTLSVTSVHERCGSRGGKWRGKWNRSPRPCPGFRLWRPASERTANFIVYLHELKYSFFSQRGYVYVFKGKSGCNLCCLAASDSRVHEPTQEPVGEGPIPRGNFHADKGSSHHSGLGSFVLSQPSAGSTSKPLYTVDQDSSRSRRSPVAPHSLSHFHVHQG